MALQIKVGDAVLSISGAAAASSADAAAAPQGAQQQEVGHRDNWWQRDDWWRWGSARRLVALGDHGGRASTRARTRSARLQTKRWAAARATRLKTRWASATLRSTAQTRTKRSATRTRKATGTTTTAKEKIGDEDIKGYNEKRRDAHDRNERMGDEGKGYMKEKKSVIGAYDRNESDGRRG